MATIAITARAAAPFLLTKTTLTAGPDTLAYVQGNGQYMELENTTGSSITVTLLGSTASSTYVVPNTGGTTINAAAGKAITVAAATTQGIFLDNLAAYLQGAVTLTGGTGLFCSVMAGQ